MAKLRKLKLLEKVYDSLYDLNNIMNYKFNSVLEQLEKEANKYGYKFKISPTDKFKLYSMTQKEYQAFKVVE